MSTSSEVKSPIGSEKTESGVRLKIHPFEGINGTRNSAMVITADVERPRKGRRAEVRVWFSGVVGGASLSMTEISIWANALRGLQLEAKRIGDSLRPSRAKSK